MSFCTSCLSTQNLDTAKFCLKCGQTLLLKDRYRPLHPLGSGGFGKAFLAIDEHLPSLAKCVVKQFCFPGSDRETYQKAAELFQQEALRLYELQHKQIPCLLANFEQEGQLYLVQELIQGETLEQEFKTQGLFNQSKIWQLLTDLLPVLNFIHTRQVIHRDIKPANIMRRSPGGDLVLIDFGVAKLLKDSKLLHPGTTVGSPEYMAPEQTRGKALPASDLYSLGVSCIYLLTGISPFDLFDITSDRWIWRDYLTPQNYVQYHLGTILDKLLQNPLSQRYQSAIDVLEEMNLSPKTEPQKPLIRSSPQVRVNYKTLQNLLASKKWQQADRETWVLMCQILSKSSGSYLFSSDIENLPGEELEKIDQLWTKYSHGRFGFSIQTEIYIDCNYDYGQFCIAVGWNFFYAFSPDKIFTFNLSAPVGHLPANTWAGGTQPGKYMKVLTQKLKSYYESYRI
jgi:serine/threonine protein kinase